MARNVSALLALVLMACGPRDSGTDAETDADAAETPPDDLGTPADMGVPKTEWDGVRSGSDHPEPVPTNFADCETGIERRLAWSLHPDLHWTGSCDGVYNRFRGVVDDTREPPVLFVEEILEARWCRPEDCGGGCEPNFDSCYEEVEQWKCDPLDGVPPSCSSGEQCRPYRFVATQYAGWRHHGCAHPTGERGHGEPCEYPLDTGAAGIVDTCADGLRCWNPHGTLDAGTCVPYCDPQGIEGSPCAGECVPCSSSIRGLCVMGCSGDDCHVADFC